MTERPDTRYPGPTMTTRLHWLLNAGFSDYLLAASVASASLPVVGKHLEPLGALTAAGVWGARHAPDALGALAKSLVTPNDAEKKQQERDSTNAVAAAALRGVVAQKDLDIEWPAAERTPPVAKMCEHRRNVLKTSVRYGPRPTQLLDVWRREDTPPDAPVMI